MNSNLVSCNQQHYEIVNRATKVEPTPEETNMDQGEEETVETNFTKLSFSLFVLVFWKNENNLVCFHVFYLRQGSSNIPVKAMKNIDVTSEEVDYVQF